MNCPRCSAGQYAPGQQDWVAEESAEGRTNGYRRICPKCRHCFATVERVSGRVVTPLKQRPTQDKGVRFEICIGDDEPGARP